MNWVLIAFYMGGPMSGGTALTAGFGNRPACEAAIQRMVDEGWKGRAFCLSAISAHMQNQAEQYER